MNITLRKNKTKEKKVKEPLPPKLKKIRWVIASMIITLVILAVTLSLLAHFGVLSEDFSKSAREINDAAREALKPQTV